MNEFQIVHRDDMETNGNWTLCRRALDLGSLGMGLVEIPAGGSIPAHDETERDQEEVFIVLSGSPVLGDRRQGASGARRHVRPHRPGAPPSRHEPRP